MRRNFERKLLDWDKKSNKKPLVVLGVRQCGKTFIINKFCKENYKKYVKVNLFMDETLINIYNNNDNYNKRKQLLCTNYNIDFADKETILFVDEVQKCPKFIQDLKLLCEDGINNIIVAGSLLSVTLKNMDESYPVGKTHIEYLYPMNFEEYLYAINCERFIPIIQESFEKNIPCPFHEKLMELFQNYLYLGGMPEVLQNYLDNDMDISKIDNSILSDIEEEYRTDITKHIIYDKDKLRARNIYNNISSQLMKENPKFMYAKFDSKERKSDYISALDWLVSSRMVVKCDQLTTPLYPIKAYQNSENYKLFLSDIGLLRNNVDIKAVDLLMNGDYPYKGVIIENYVALELLTQFNEIFYWTRKNDSNGNKAEVDFVIQINNQVIPIEVKSSNNKAQSLKVYNEVYHPNLMIKIGNTNFGKIDNIKTIPLYATFLLKKCLENKIFF